MTRRVIQVTGYVFLSLFGVFLVYVNAESRPAHTQAKAVNMIVIGVENEVSEKEMQSLTRYLGGLKGVTAVQAGEESKKISILFQKQVISAETIIEGIEKKGIEIKPVVFEQPSSDVPECPVPLKYIERFEEIKQAFNFRK